MLLIISNGVVVDDEHNFRQGVLTRRRIDETIRRLRSQELIPDLTDIQVALVGVGYDPVGYTLTTEQEQGLHRFWRRYIAETGGILIYMQPRMTELPPLQ